MIFTALKMARLLTMAAALLVATLGACYAQSLDDVNRCYSKSASPLSDGVTRCTRLINSQDSIMQEQRAQHLVLRGTKLYLMKEFNTSISDFTEAIQANRNEQVFTYNIDGKISSLKVNAIAHYGRGVARLRTGDKAGGDSDIAAAKALQPDISRWANEKFGFEL